MRSDQADRRLRPLLITSFLTALAGVMLSTGAWITPASTQPVKPRPNPLAGPPPAMTPAAGSFVEGEEVVAASPTVPGDSVDSLWVDDRLLVGSLAAGTATLTFDVGANPIEGNSHLIVNGRRRIDLPGLGEGRASIDVPNRLLRKGENTIAFVAGDKKSDCGHSRDDFTVGMFELELLGEVADGEDNDVSYALGDGRCGSGPMRKSRVELAFFVHRDPTGTLGLTTPLDTTTLANGEHTLTAVTESGARAEHSIRVNNAPPGAPRLTPPDGALVTGEQKVLASFLAGTPGSVASFAVDGTEMAGTPSLGHGSATFSFDVGRNSIATRYHNLVLVNGEKSDLGGDFVDQRVDVPFPNDRLVPGRNTITVVAGEADGACGENLDDFTISDPVLTPAAGTAIGDDLQASYSVGDGGCGSAARTRPEIELTFTVDAPVAGLRATLDTTALVDGDHSLTATSATGETATRLLVVDNTAPEVASSVPAAGSTITSAVPLAVELADASAVVGAATYTLDGEPIEPGAGIGPGLPAGDHTIAVTATDSVGNTATREIGFLAAGVPDVPTNLAPATGDAEVGERVRLSAEVAEPGGGPVTASFSRAEILVPTHAWQGTSDAVPTTLPIPGEERAESSGLLPSAAATGVAYQRFDVPLEASAAEPVVRWEGTIDPARRAVLHAWDVDAQTWDPVASSRGVAGGATVLSATLGGSQLDEGVAHLLVTGEDPFADDIDAGGRTGFDDPDTYDFSLVHYTDTQYITEAAVEKETAAERAVWEQAYGDVTRWVARNAERRKIAYVAHAGDLTENNIRRPRTAEQLQQVVSEMELSSRQQRVLDDAGVPNGVIAGNHDNQSGTDDGPDAIFNRYYGPQRYEAAATTWTNASYGGPWRPGDNQNHYDLFSAGGLDFVVVGLSYGVTREEAEWADSVFKRYPDRNGIVLSHDYLKPSASPDGRGSKFSAPDGAMLFNTIVAPNPNVFLILCGHEHGVGTNVKPQVATFGNGVVELLADYQFYTVDAERMGLTAAGGYAVDDELRFGASFFRMLQFDVDRGEMSIDTYSPLLDDFGATEFDFDHRYNGQEDTMVLPVDLSSRTTSFTTDSIAIYAPTDTIGEASVPSGGVASVVWGGLPPGTEQAWVVTARSAAGGVTSSTPQVFTTAADCDRAHTLGAPSVSGLCAE